MSNITQALDDAMAALLRVQQRHPATGYVFDRLFDRITAAKAEAWALEAAPAAERARIVEIIEKQKMQYRTDINVEKSLDRLLAAISEAA